MMLEGTIAMLTPFLRPLLKIVNLIQISISGNISARSAAKLFGKLANFTVHSQSGAASSVQDALIFTIVGNKVIYGEPQS
jgi:hypothetical protein